MLAGTLVCLVYVQISVIELSVMAFKSIPRWNQAILKMRSAELMVICFLVLNGPFDFTTLDWIGPQDL